MDPFSDVIALIRPTAVFSKSITGRGNWGVHYGAYEAPGFSVIIKGHCWLETEGNESILLNQGDFILLPTSPAFSLRSHPEAQCVTGWPKNASVRHGEQEGEPDFEALGGTFQLDPVNAPLLLALLPDKIHIRAAEGDTGRLTRIIELILDESSTERPGREMILERHLEVMLIECLRWPGVADGSMPAGLLTGMRSPAIAKVLRAIHSDVRAGWTVAQLAKLAGMSRSAFAARFAEIVGCAPIEYLARWRMALAKDALSRGGQSLERLALTIGYESASAFSTAFRRRTGCSPGAFARALRSDLEATPSLEAA